MKDEERSAKISRILENFSQIRSTNVIKDRKKTDLTIGMTGIDGKLRTDRASTTEDPLPVKEDPLLLEEEDLFLS